MPLEPPSFRGFFFGQLPCLIYQVCELPTWGQAALYQWTLSDLDITDVCVYCQHGVAALYQWTLIDLDIADVWIAGIWIRVSSL